MAAGLTIRRDRLDAFRERFGAVARETLGPDDLGPEQRVDLELGLARGTDELERLCRHLEPCGTGNPSPVFGVRGVRFAGRARVGNGHLKGTLDDGDHPAPAIGFQWADRVPWLGEGLVDAAFRLEATSGTDAVTLQARLCACAPSREQPTRGLTLSAARACHAVTPRCAQVTTA